MDIIGMTATLMRLICSHQAVGITKILSNCAPNHVRRSHSVCPSNIVPRTRCVIGTLSVIRLIQLGGLMGKYFAVVMSVTTTCVL